MSNPFPVGIPVAALDNRREPPLSVVLYVALRDPSDINVSCLDLQ